MAAKEQLHAYLQAVLLPDEEVVTTTTVQLKGGLKKQLGKTMIAGTAAALAVSAATGGTMGVLVVSVPPAAWAVVTTQRLLLVERTNAGKSLGRLVFAAPRQALTATLKSGLLNEITVVDAADGQSLVRLNVGVKRALAKEIAAVVSG
jgi:hypothetical protein